MAKLSRRAREKLPKKKFACPANAPGPGSYPIDTKKRVSSAKAYYQRPNTTKCKSGKKRICAAAAKLGMMNPDWRRWCKIPA